MLKFITGSITDFHSSYKEYEFDCIIFPKSNHHPKDQTQFGVDICALEMEKEDNRDIKIISFSEHILNGIRLAVLRKIIPADKIEIIFINEQGTNKIQILENGDLSDWPKDFMDNEQRVFAEMTKLLYPEK